MGEASINKRYELLTLVAGVKLRWSSDCEHEIQKLEKLFLHHRCKEQEAPEAPLHTIEFRPVWEPLQMPNDVVTKWDGYYVGCFHQKNHVHWYHSAATELDYLVLSHEMWVIHDRSSARTICCMLCRKTMFRHVERPDIADPIVILIHTVMAMYNRYTIHAAAVELGGFGHVFVGESGHGKSTLSTDLVKQGATYMGDDIVFLFEEQGQLRVGSLLFEAKLFPPHTKRRKDFIDVVSRSGCKVLQSAPIKNLYYVRRSKEELSRLERQEPIEAVVRLMRASNNARMQYDVEVWQDICQRVADEIPFYAFWFGRRDLLDKSLFEHA